MKILKYTLSTALLSVTLLNVAAMKGYNTDNIKTAIETIKEKRQEAKDAKIQEIFKALKNSAGIETYRIPLFITEARTPNAYANFKQQVFITRGMLELLDYDEDSVAYVLGHELGHHMLLHTSHAEFYGSSPFLESRYLEYMADLVSIPLVNGAGYNACKGATVWTKFGENFGYDILSESHPNFDVRHNYILRLCGE